MTRRILLTLDESVTETECGECSLRTHRWCEPLGVRLDYVSEDDDRLVRHPECLAAEKAAERCVEIAPEDADLATVPTRRISQGLEDALPGYAAASERIQIALKEHAAKARKGGERG